MVKSGIILAEKNSPKGWDWASVVRANSASDWQFVPVGAQHRNGLAEATVKVLKQSLKHAIAPGVTLSYSELNTLLAEILFTINCRPHQALLLSKPNRAKGKKTILQSLGL